MSSASWFGTSRIETFADARAGITVFAPGAWKPPTMPCTSSVGRAQVRYSTEYPGSPVSTSDPTSALRYSSSLNGRPLPGFQLVVRRLLHVVVEAGNQHLAVGVLQLAENLDQPEDRVRRGATVHAGVQIGLRALRFQLGVDQAAQSDAQRRKIGREQFGVGYQREVGLQLVRRWRCFLTILLDALRRQLLLRPRTGRER